MWRRNGLHVRRVWGFGLAAGKGGRQQLEAQRAAREEGLGFWAGMGTRGGGEDHGEKILAPVIDSGGFPAFETLFR